MKRVIGLFAVMLILSLPAWTQQHGAKVCRLLHLTVPKDFVARRIVEARIGSTYNVRLGPYVQYFG